MKGEWVHQAEIDLLMKIATETIEKVKQEESQVLVPERILKIFRDKPEIKVVVDGEDRYYRGARSVPNTRITLPF